MATEIKNAFKEIVDRLELAHEGGLLVGVKLVEGPTEEVYAQSDLPVIIYEILEGGFAEDTHFPKCDRYKFTMLFTVMTDVAHGYYDDNGQGIIDLFEKLMTVLDQSRTTGALDLTGANTWGPVSPQYRVGEFEKSGMIFQYLVEGEFQTNRYERGKLRT